MADGGYQSAVAACAAARAGLRLRIAKRDPHAKREVLPRRRVIERTFAWLERNRRLSKDFEHLVEASTAIVGIIQRLARRLATASFRTNPSYIPPLQSIDSP